MFKVLAARITVFALACTWVLGLLIGGITILPTFYNVLEESITSTLLLTFVAFWYLTTLVIIGTLVAVWGFKFVGRWEKNAKNPSK